MIISIKYYQINRFLSTRLLLPQIKRHGTQPHKPSTILASGLLVKFENSTFFERAFLKEVYYNNSIHLPCRSSAINGDINVRCNTENEAFFSPFDWIGGTITK